MLRNERLIPFMLMAAILAAFSIVRFNGNSEYPRVLHTNQNYFEGSNGADFGQVYFSSRAWRAGESPYHPVSQKFKDPMGRVSAYPPFTVVALAPLSFLSFPRALNAHLAIELLVLLLVLFVVGHREGWRNFLSMALLLALILLISPVGSQFLTQGQFDLYVAASCYLAISNQEKKSKLGYFFAGLLAAVKWTALPVLFFLTVWNLCLTKSKSILMAWLALGLSLLFSPWRSLEYFGVMSFWESQSPAGVSFYHLTSWLDFPGVVVPLLYVLLVVGAVMLSRGAGGESRLSGFLVSLSILSVGIGKMAFDYRAMALLGVWMALYRRGNHRSILVIFGVFLIMALRVWPFFAVDEIYMSALYFLTGLTIYLLTAISRQTSR